MVLVDTPGTGESTSWVAEAAEGALESSSVYVFITTYTELKCGDNVKYIESLLALDQGVYIRSCVHHLEVTTIDLEIFVLLLRISDVTLFCGAGLPTKVIFTADDL